MIEIQWFQVVLQGGSFAVLVLIVVWLGKVAFPTLVKVYEGTRREFLESLDKIEARNAQRDETLLRLTLAIERLEQRIEGLAAKREGDEP